MSDVFNILGKAIVKRINIDVEGVALKAALTGGFYYEEAPRKSTPPYATYEMTAGPRLSTYTSEIENVDITFMIYVAKQSPADCFTIFNLLTNVFDDVVLTVTGFKMIRSDRGNSTPEKDPDREGYRMSVIYSAML